MDQLSHTEVDFGDFIRIRLRCCRKLSNREQCVLVEHSRCTVRQVGRDTATYEVADATLELVAVASTDQGWQLRTQFCNRWSVTLDLVFDHEEVRSLVDKPARRTVQQTNVVVLQGNLRIGVDLVVQCTNFLEVLLEVEHFTHRGKHTSDVRNRGSGLFHKAEDIRQTTSVNHAVHQVCCRNFTEQRVRCELVAVLLGQRLREVLQHMLLHKRFVWNIRFENRIGRVHLDVRKQNSQFRRGETHSAF